MAAFTAIAIGLMVGGALLKANAQRKQGNAAKAEGEAQQRSAEAQAQLSDYNAAVADVQARDAEERGALDAHRFRQRTRALIGEQRAGFAAGNVDVGFGSMVDVQADSAFVGELDALQIRTNAAREAWGYKVEGEDLRKRAEITRQEGGQALAAGKERQKASRWDMAGTVIGAGASLYEAKYGFGGKK